MLIPAGSLWCRVVRDGGGGRRGEGRLSLCPTKKSPYRDMNLNKVRTKGGGLGGGEG